MIAELPLVRVTNAWARLSVGRTPHREIPLDGPAVLRHYRPAATAGPATPSRGPIFVLYAMVNRPYVLDLQPGHSVVERLVAAGHEVFLLDWGTPGPREAGRSIESYLRGTVRAAVERARAEAHARRLTLLGYCQGGTYAVLYANLFPRHVDRLILMAAPLDFSQLGLLSTWARVPGFDGTQLLDGSGNVSGLALRWGFEMLRPFEAPVRYLRFWEKAGAWAAAGPEAGPAPAGAPALSDEELEHFLAMERWVNDPTDHPGRAFREFHAWFYRDNALFGPGVRLGRVVARLEKIRCPVLLLVGRRDHLVPPAGTLAARARLTAARRVDVIECDCGHIGLSVSSRAATEVWPRVLSWIEG